MKATSIGSGSGGYGGIGGSEGRGGMGDPRGSDGKYGSVGKNGNKGENAEIFYFGTQSEWGWRDEKDSINNADIYFYSEAEPTTTGNYWHYKNGQPIVL